MKYLLSSRSLHTSYKTPKKIKNKIKTENVRGGEILPPPSTCSLLAQHLNKMVEHPRATSFCPKHE
jgi:hypothetical protein